MHHSIRHFLTALATASTLATTALAERSYLDWAQVFDRLNTSVTQRGVGTAMDQRGNVFATGYVDTGSADTWYTAKYDSLTGALVWSDTFSAAVGDARPAAIAIDGDGNPIVSGYTNTSVGGHDFFTIKYNGSTGARTWTRSYNNPGNGADEVIALAVDASGNAIVTGRSQGTGTQADIQTIKYAAANGADVWAADPRLATSFVDEPRAIAVDPSGNVAVAGFSRVGSDRCFYTAKYNGATGALIWDETYDDTVNDDDDAGTGVAMDATGNVFVTGTSRRSDGSYAFHTIMYKSAANATQQQWSRTYNSPDGNPLDPTSQSGGLVSPETFSPYIGIDPTGDPIIAGTADLDGFKTVYYVAKYDASANGAILWQSQSAEAGGNDFVNDNVNALVVDSAGNAIVTGRAQNPDDGSDGIYYTVKFDGGTGAILWEQLLNGDVDKGNDVPFGISADPGGNVAVTGFARKPNSNVFEMLTVKYSRHLLATGDAIAGPGLTTAAFISALNTPALADSGAIATRVTVKDGKKSFAAICSQAAGGGNFATGLQGQPAPGVTGGLFKSFGDPVIAPNGRHAYAAKLTGVTGAEAAGVWTNVFTGATQLAIQQGKQAPGLGAGVLVKGVTGITLRDNQLVALLSLKGTGITGANSTAIVAITGGVATKLLQTGDMVSNSPVKKLSFFTPPKTSAGHGRWHGTNRIVASAALADKRIALVTVSSAGALTTMLASEGDAAIIAAGAKWKTFGPPAIGSGGGFFTALATLKPKDGGIASSTDTAIVFSNNAVAFSKVATEGAAANGGGGAIYAGFSDPLVNDQGRVAFLATLKGTGVSGSNKTALYYGTPAAPFIVARTGNLAPDAIGDPGTAKFTGITSIALPGSASGLPIFLGKVAGKNPVGLWGVDSDGFLRQLLRAGDVLGDVTVKKFTVLGAIPGVAGATRSFNNTGGIAALVTLSDKTTSIIYVGIP